MKKRNSILEILRVCASLWVMYYHGYSLITRTQAFSNGRIAVDFFFILSGFFFLSSYHKEDDKGWFKGLLNFAWKRFKPLAFTFFICLYFSFAYFLAGYDGLFSTSIIGYLWYVPKVIYVTGVYFILRRLIKNDLGFYITVGVISVINYVIILTYTFDAGWFRGLAGIGMGILLSLIPKLNFKGSQIVAGVSTLLIFAGITLIAALYPVKEVEDPVCLLVLFPGIIYFASNVNFSNVVINKICAISFGLYAYQTVSRLLDYHGILPDGWKTALLVIGLATLDLIVKEVFRYIIKRQKEAI